MHEFTKELYRIIDESKPRPIIMDFIYDELDEMLLAKKFRDVDQILSEIDIGKLSAAFILGILTITMPWFNEVPTRYDFYRDAEKHLLTKHSKEEVEKLLHGFKR